jgi:hypothetical protein
MMPLLRLVLTLWCIKQELNLISSDDMIQESITLFVVVFHMRQRSTQAFLPLLRLVLTLWCIKQELSPVMI